jgi:hypothetical protein
MQGGRQYARRRGVSVYRVTELIGTSSRVTSATAVLSDFRREDAACIPGQER